MGGEHWNSEVTYEPENELDQSFDDENRRSEALHAAAMVFQGTGEDFSNVIGYADAFDKYIQEGR